MRRVALLALSLCCLPGYLSVSLVTVNVPTYKHVGESATLLCDFDLQGRGLYSIRWYKDDVEFYRYVPSSRQPKRVFTDVPGIFVNTAASDERRVSLGSLELNSTGHFQCQVSDEAPTFHTFSDGATMMVVALPKAGPFIFGQDSARNTDGFLSLNCTADKSKPAARLQWLINNHQAQSQFVSRLPTIVDSSGMETATLGLRLPLRSDMFRSGATELTCRATVLVDAPPAGGAVAADGRLQRHEVLSQRRATITVRSGAATPVTSELLLVSLLLAGAVMGASAGQLRAA
ncbi:uncharacterized protein LOC119111918 [Pollicipes pollicipes]|uniref:uncharacterized protein LOC119111918 n=1 Tax=Pollicipes pollicipes TaxID=41117 RepID=UPI0018853C15|nr:uncharacterized protein LOC119111918 [Pollicipes pollicipes]